MAALKVEKIVLSDGTEIDATALANITFSENGNVEISSPKNVNIEPTKSVKFKPGSGAQIEFLSDHTGDLTEVLLKALCAVDKNGADLVDEKGNKIEIPIRFKFNCTETEYNTKGAADVDTFDVKFKTGRKEGKGNIYPQVKLKGRSFDIRCMEHGGIALQPNGHDGEGHENKIKFESNRTSKIGEAAAYNGSGGDGMEFGTFNNEHTSLYTGDYRFKGDAKVYGVTRGELVEDPTTHKIDYPTQSDDFKDIIDPDNCVTWQQIIDCVKGGGGGNWYGTQAEFDALGTYSENVNYHIYD